MKDALEHPFLANHAVTQVQMDEILENQEKLLAGQAEIKELAERTLANTEYIKIVSDETSKKLDKSTHALLTAIVEVGDIAAPTTFVILPQKLPKEGEEEEDFSLVESFAAMDEVAQLAAAAEVFDQYHADKDGMKKKWRDQAKVMMKSPEEVLAFVESMESKMKGFKESVQKVEGVAEELSSIMSDPVAWGKKKIKAKANEFLGKFEGETFWLYLVDEYVRGS